MCPVVADVASYQAVSVPVLLEMTVVAVAALVPVTVTPPS